MKKVTAGLFITCLLFMIFAGSNFALADEHNAYDFSFTRLLGGKLNLKDYKGKVIIVVNTASHCSFTSQYASLEKLYEKYSNQGLVIIGVPSNNFGTQEPGSNQEIEAFCRKNYGVKFPMAGKEDVIGDNAHPFFVWVKKQLGNDAAPKWNFYKYIINRNGHLVAYYNSFTPPDSNKLTKQVESLLKN